MIVLPKKIHLAATGKRWRVSYIHTPGRLSMIELPKQKLVIYGKHYRKRATINLLVKWIKAKSQAHLNASTIKQNQIVKVKYRKLRVRSLKAGWGNCSSDKTISLNYAVIFLPRSLVKHLIIHELCHIRHLNHSDKFWQEVAKYDKRWKKNRAALHEADAHIPDWMMIA